MLNQHTRILLARFAPHIPFALPLFSKETYPKTTACFARRIASFHLDIICMFHTNTPLSFVCPMQIPHRVLLAIAFVCPVERHQGISRRASRAAFYLDSLGMLNHHTRILPARFAHRIQFALPLCFQWNRPAKSRRASRAMLYHLIWI